MPDGTGDKYALGSNWAQNTTVNSILYALYETIIQDVNKTSVSRFIDNSQGGGQAMVKSKSNICSAVCSNFCKYRSEVGKTTEDSGIADE